MTTNNRGVEEAFAQAFPLGDYDAEHTTRAARLCGEAVRYLNHATNWDGERALPDPAAICEALGALTEALERMPQLFQQVSRRCRQHAADPRLATSDWDDDFASGLAEGSADELDRACAAVPAVISRVRSAVSGMSDLYLANVDTDSNEEADVAGW